MFSAQKSIQNHLVFICVIVFLSIFNNNTIFVFVHNHEAEYLYYF